MVSPSPLGTAPGGSQQVGVCKEAARGYTRSNKEVNVLKARLCRLKKTVWSQKLHFSDPRG